MPTSSAMISKETSERLSALMYSPSELSKLYIQFVNGEQNCSKDVFTFIKSYTKTTLKGCGVFDIDLENPEQLLTEDFSEMIEASNEVSQILMVVFSAGIAYGKSMFYDDFDNSFGAGVEKEEKDDKPDIF